VTLDDLKSLWGTQDKKQTLQKHLLLIAAGLVMGLIGPYDSSEQPNIFIRFFYWISLIGAGSLISGPLARLVFMQGEEFQVNSALAFGYFCVAISLAVFPMVIGYEVLLDIFYGNGQVTRSYIIGFLSAGPFDTIENIPLIYLLWFAQVLIITLMVFGVTTLLLDKLYKQPEDDVLLPLGSRFLNRLPTDIGVDLICLSMEDHYIRVHTKLGSAMILMRMADAVAELADYPGMQVHRSWWVAINAIRHITKEKRRHVIQLDMGLSAPVSKTYVEGLKAKGYL